MRCSECERRFVCYTLAVNERPQRVRVNWAIQTTCGMCQHVRFTTKVEASRTVPRPVGICDATNMLVHKNSAACNEGHYKPRIMSKIDKVYKEIQEMFTLRNRNTKLPKYCLIEE